MNQNFQMNRTRKKNNLWEKHASNISEEIIIQPKDNEELIKETNIPRFSQVEYFSDMVYIQN